MSKLGRQDGEPLIVDLRSMRIETWQELWDALATTCGLPEWFGRNLNAWWDTIQTGAISRIIDDHPSLVVRVNTRGLFAPGAEGQWFVDRTNLCDYAMVEVEDA